MTHRILILGSNHAGKDSMAAALIVASKGKLRYDQSSSYQLAKLVPEWREKRDLEDWWSRRRHHRQVWIDAFDRLRAHHGDDICAQYLFGYCKQNIVTGIRYARELSALLLTDNKPTTVIWCRFAARYQLDVDYDLLDLDQISRLCASHKIPLFATWGEQIASVIWGMIDGNA